jgi:Fe-S cluster assembly iron-binding protein IscA
MALDEPRDGDEQFQERGITFLITTDLFEQIKPVYVDFIEDERGSGFQVTSSLAPGDCCGSCSC